jgi:hypothetical protein
VLETSSPSGLVVLDLLSRMASPLLATSQASVSIAPDGMRMWAYSPGGSNLAAIDFATLTPIPLNTDPPIDAVYDVARPATAGAPSGGRSLIAIHKEGTVGATVFDAMQPDNTTARRAPALLLEGP